MKRALLTAAVAVALSSCLRYERIVLTIDLPKRRATIEFRALSSLEPAVDASRLVTWAAKPADDLVIEKVNFEDMLDLVDYQVVSKRVVTSAGQLDGEVVITFPTPVHVGVERYDAEHPHRYCPPRADVVIARSNAQFRDDRGCVLWTREVTTLRVELVPLETPYDPKPLFDAYVKK